MRRSPLLTVQLQLYIAVFLLLATDYVGKVATVCLGMLERSAREARSEGGWWRL